MSDQAPIQIQRSPPTSKWGGRWKQYYELRKSIHSLRNAGMSIEEIKIELAKRKPKKPLQVVHIDEQFKKGIG
ncbi:MAG: hypothetical protein VX313_04965 [Bacteroidota bacterium]|nr:hypothetical protein [Bacteroidota bacterium]